MKTFCKHNVAPPVCLTDLDDVLHFQDAAVGDGARHRGGNGQQELGVHLRGVRTDGMSIHGGHGLGRKSHVDLVVRVEILLLQQLRFRGRRPR